MASDELLRAIELQAAASRELEEEQRASSQARGIYSNADKRTASGKKYTQMGAVSIAEGTNLAGNFDPETGEVVWAETWDTGQPGSELSEKIKCANGTDCLFNDVCYGWYECDPCDWCENNTCVPRDENRPCGATWECPCPPNDRQHYECIDGDCSLTCTVNSDCGECQVCDLRSGFCTDGCKEDSDCNPRSQNAAGDAQANTLCENCECVYPCDPVRYCLTDSDCFDREYCGEREYFVNSDPEGAQYQCIEGCRFGQCRDEQGELDILSMLEDVRAEAENRAIIENDLRQYQAGLTNGSTTAQDVAATELELQQSIDRIEQLTNDIADLRQRVDEYNRQAVCDPESRTCYKACTETADCSVDESCENGKCESAGQICVTSSDCSDGEYCNEDGRCAGGCETNNDCTRACSKDAACVNECPPIGNCTCTGDGCFNPNWIELCPRDPQCIAACPDDEACIKSNLKDTCIDHRCEQTCSTSSQCSDGDLCVEGFCMHKQADPTEPADSRIGCDCGDTCNQFGTCEVVICKVDEQCPSCSICEDGVCIEGCSDDNPCPDGACCNADGRCSKKCSNDLDCATEQGNQLCLEGGCCGFICDPLVPCISTADCSPGQYCGDEQYCLEGCFQDADCSSLIEPGSNTLMRCSKNYVQAPNGVIAPCEFYPDEECFSEVGLCTAYCNSDADCEAGETCVDESCSIPPTTCDNDDGCESGEICKNHTCTFGCRFDSQCGEDEICVNNSCELKCDSNEVCVAILGDSGFCNSDGICAQVNKGTTSEGGHKGCECYEFCDQNGYCKPFVCDSDLDCEEEACGSCLVGNVCGECDFDEDCPGSKVCDNKDEDGERRREPFNDREQEKYQLLEQDLKLALATNAPQNAVQAILDQMRTMREQKPYVKGLCAYACTPGGPLSCIGSQDCDEGFYCEAGQCTRGCKENSDCNPSQVCKSEQCVDKCNENIVVCAGDNDCAFNETCRDGKCTSCPEYHQCIEGGCQFVGATCDPENDRVKEIEDIIFGIKVKSVPDANDQARLDEMNYKKAVIEQEEQSPERDQKIQHLQAQIDHILSLYPPLTAEEQAQVDYYEEQLIEAKNRDCPAGQECNTDTCEPKPIECLADFECTYPEVCAPMGRDGALICYEEPTDESYAAFDPAVIGCESCADFCAPGGVCKPMPCNTTQDCNCGFCGGSGVCIETCQTDFDCGGGRCKQGECIECITNSDCVRQFGEGTLCNEGKCDTPCYTGLSTGDCFTGLLDGDTCHSCPEQCPTGAPCRKVDEVCNVEQVYDVLQERMKVHITNCEVCRNSCITSSDCEDGTVCGGFGYCRQTDGRCTYDSDCAEQALQDGKEYQCSNNTCIEVGVTCFTNSDCDEGEVCDEGKCTEGECGSADTCQQGKTCIHNQCVWQCGAGSDVFLCGDEGNCPPGFYCSAEDTIGGYCLRAGVTLSTVAEPECATGEFCCDGGCIRKGYGENECCNDGHCGGNKKCCDGVCKFRCEEKTSTTAGSTDNAGKQEQDNCEAKNKCCGDDGYCQPCGCDEKNPCKKTGQCCDRDTGQCISVEEHPNTKYGSPDGCTIDRVFCELYDSEENQIIPEELGDERHYRACEVIDAVTGELRCVEGGEKLPFQIDNLLKDACFVSETKECKCDDIPETDECVNDDDCGPCADCYEKTYRSDACCGIYGEGEITSSTGYGIPTGVDYITRKICKEHPWKESPEECGCRSDDDCTECEYCDGGSLNKLGKCKEDCEAKCPCGGSLSEGKECPTCQKRHGPCAIEGSFESGEEYIDPITGELVLPPTQCACILDRTKDCCQGFNSIADLKNQKLKCLQSTTALADGTLAYNRTEKCLDYKKDICAQCETDAQCPGNQKCKNYTCITECGSEDSNPGRIGAADGQDLGEIGGNPYFCYCCSKQGDCRSKYETWIESKGKAKGPWEITYYLNEDPNTIRDYYSSQENYDNAVREVKNAWPSSTLTIVSADGEEQSGDCRPCTCTETGIQCGAWADCESCFKWEKQGPGIDVGPSAEVMRVEQKIRQTQDSLDNFEDNYQERLINLQNASAAYESAIVQQTINNGYNQNVSNQLEQLRESYNEEIKETDEELYEATEKVKVLEKKIELALFNEKHLDLENLEQQLTQSETERDALQERSDELDELLDQNEEDINELLEDLPNDAQLQLDVKYRQLEHSRYMVRQSRRYIQQQEQLLRDLQNDLAKVQNPDSVYYEQVRVCGCCMGGTCRDDSECTYGTCYMCVTEYDNTPGKAYNAQLYGKVLKNIISPDSPDRTGEEEMNGKFRWDYQHEKDTCVKYDCSQSLYYEDRPGVAYQNRYWEYCIGGLMACINEYWEGKQYRQGWVYEVDLSESGTYFTTDYQNWVKIGRYPGQKWPQRAECLHDNDAAGALGFNTMVTFEDLVAGHPICNKAELVYGCTPGNEGCGAVFDTYFEAGSQDLVILKMVREIEELNALIAWLEGYVEFVEKFIEDQEKEIENLETLLEQLESQIDIAIQVRNNAMNEVLRLENLFKQTDGSQSGIDSDIEAKQEAFDAADEKLTELQQTQADKESQIEQQELINDTAKNNLLSAQSAANTLYLSVSRLQVEITELKVIISETDPLSSEYVILENELANKEADLSVAQEDYLGVVSDMLVYEEEVKLGERLIEINSCDLPEDYTQSQYEREGYGECISFNKQLENAITDVDEQRPVWTQAELALREAKSVKGSWVDDRESIFSDMQNAKNSLENAEAQLQSLNERAGLLVWNPDKCKEGYAPAEDSFGNKICCKVNENGEMNCGLLNRISRGDHERECKNICEQIEQIREVIYNAEGQKQELETLKANTEDERDAKQEEVDELIEKDENSTPPYATGPVKRPQGTKDAKELMEELRENIELNEYLDDKDTWPPGRA